MFERLDYRPLRIAPLLSDRRDDAGLRASRRGSTRIRAKLAADLRERLTLADADRKLGEALDRWELSLFADEPFRSAHVREGLACLLGDDGGRGAAAMRTAVLLGEQTAERADLLGACARSGCAATHATRCAGRSSRRSCTGAAPSSSRALDGALLGVRPRPASVLRVACKSHSRTRWAQARVTLPGLRSRAWTRRST